MDLLSHDRNPETCLSLGLDCRNCIGRSAETVAAICRGMSSTAVHSIFFQLYPSAGCEPMRPVFESAYAEASIPRKPVVRVVVAA